MSSWGAALRIARRDAMRARGRSALVLAMIALPVLGIAAMDVAVRTYDLSADQKATRSMGRADAALTDTQSERIQQYRLGDTVQYESVGQDCAPAPGGGQACSVPVRTSPVDLEGLLPAGSRTLEDTTAYGPVTAPGRSSEGLVRELAYADPLARGTYRQVEGREPRTADEVALTEALSRRLSAGPGDEVRVAATERLMRVVGVVADADDKAQQTAVVGPGALTASRDAQRRLLVDLPAELRWPFVQQLNDRGVLVEGRGPIPGAPPALEEAQALVDQQTLTAVTLVAGMALLEIVLLAGPAFAVGTKRQSRDLALVAATGGERRDVRRVVLGGGLVLGLTAGALGVAGGVALGANAEPLVGRFDSSVPGPVDLRPLELLAIASVGVVTALLAALLPAFLAARQDVVAALTGRRGTRRSSRAVPALGAVAAGIGALIAFEGARQRDLNVVLAGSIVAELGLVAMTPVLVGAAGRLGPLLPAAPRLALRDASRNRGRTAPAVSAILAAVAGSVAVGTFVSSLDAKDRAAYSPQALSGTSVVQLNPSGRALSRAEVEAALRQGGLTVEDVTPVGGLRADRPDGSSVYVQVQVPPSFTGEDSTPFRAFSGTSGITVGGPAVLEAVTGARGTSLTAALERGAAVVPRPYLTGDGTVTLSVEEVDETGASGPVRVVRVPAVALPSDAEIQTAVFPQAAVTRTGLATTTSGMVVRTRSLPSGEQQAAAQSALEGLGAGAYLVVERGYQSDYGAALYILLGASALLVLGASGMATGLAAADGRADLSTLAAVGATPSLRRRLAGFQSLVTAGLGTALGVVAGLVPALGLIGALNSPIGADGGGVFATGDYPYALPWTNLAVTVVVVPLVAGLAAMALTRSRLTLIRRAAA